MDTCTLKFFEDATTTGGISYRQCVTEDPVRFFVKGNVPAGSITEEYTHYYSQCPANHQFLETSESRACVATCTEKTYKVDDNNNLVCTPTCPNFRQKDMVIVKGETYYNCVDTCEQTSVEGVCMTC